MDDGECDQQCNNNDGGYSCACTQPGYVLFSADGTSGYNIPTTYESGTRANDTLYLNHTCVCK